MEMDTLQLRSPEEKIDKNESEDLFLNEPTTSTNNHSKGKHHPLGNKQKNNNLAQGKNKNGNDRKCCYYAKTNHLIKAYFQKRKD